MTLTETEFQQVCTYVLHNFGIDLSKKQFLIESKMTIELARLNMDSFSLFWNRLILDRDPQYKNILMDALTTNYSYFYREESHFQFLKDTILGEQKMQGTLPFHIWCAGCAGGQEAYTIGMQMLECQKLGIWNRDFSIRASDISPAAVAGAQKGVYPISDYVRLPKLWQQEYCMLTGTSFEIKQSVHRHIRFFQENLLQKPDITIRYHVVFCRNVLIYFNEATRKQLLKRLTESLMPGGYLLIGHSESVRIEGLPLEYIKPSIYRKTGGRHV